MDKLKEKEVLFIKSKNILIVCLVLVLIFGVGVSFAADTNQADTLHAINNDTAVSVSDSDAVSITYDDNSSSVNDNALRSSNDDKLSDSAGSFSELSTLIKGIETGGTLTLEKNFEYDSSSDSPLLINKAITIDGNGYNIKGNDIGTLISVTGNNVILKNLKFTDTGSNCDQIIYWSGDDGQIINLYFYNITSTYTISLVGHNDKISDSKLYNTTQIYGTSYSVNNTDFKNITRVFELPSGCTMSVYNCNFTNVHQILYTFRGTPYFENIRVLDSVATIIDSGLKALLSDKDYFVVKNSYFEGNSGDYILSGGVQVYNSTFKSNDVLYLVGTYAGGGQYSGVTVDGCTFEDNNNYLFNINNPNFKLLNSKIENNNIINIPVTKHSFIMDNCTFKSNTASGDALIIFSSDSDKSRIVNSKFINNNDFTKAPIYITKGSFYSYNNTFTNNKNSGGSVSSIVNNVGTVFPPRDVVYVSPNGKGDGSINNRTNLTNALSIVSFGGTIYLQPGEYTDLTNRVNLYANVIGEDSGVIIKKGIFNNYLYNGIIKNITFYDMQYAFYITVTHSNIINCTFSNYNKSGAILGNTNVDYAHGHNFINITIINSQISGILASNQHTLDYKLENINIIDSSVTGSLVDFGTTGDNIVKNITCIRSNFTNNLLNFRLAPYTPTYGHIITVEGLNLKNCIFDKAILDSKNTYAPTNINNVVLVDCTTKSTLFTGVLCTYSDITVNNSNKDYTPDIFNMDSEGYSITNVNLNNLDVGNIISSTSQAFTFDGLKVYGVSGSYGFIGISGSEFKNFNFTNVEFTKLGVLYASSTLKDSNFSDYKGHVEVSGDNVVISGSTFKNGVNTGMNGGAIELLAGDIFLIDNCNFINNRATNGGAVYINNVTNSSYIMNSIFTSNLASTNGGAIYIEKGIYYYVSENTRDTLGYNNPTNNLYKETGVLETQDVVWVSYGGTGGGTYSNPCAFEDCLDYVSPYGTIMFKGVGQSYSYSSIVNRDYLKPGLKIYGNYSIISNYHFNIDALATGIEIYNLILKDVTTDSVIIWNGDDGKIVNCTFEDNGGENVRYGAALKVGGDNLEISKTVFENNRAINSEDGFSYGGAIYCNASGLNLNNCSFSENTVYGYGSHIYLDENANDICINNTRFINGMIFGSSAGSAIYIISQSNLTICKSTFIGNDAVDGGALNIHAVIANVKIYNNTFTSNEASHNGGAIAITCSAIGNLEMYNNIYQFNSAKNGGAIYSNVGFSETGSTFKSNSATDGSAIYLVGGNSLTLTNDKFESNTASSHGAIYLGSGASINPDDLTFKSNTNGNIYFAGDYTASEFYVNQTGGGSGMSSSDPTTLTTAIQHVSTGGRIIFLSNIGLTNVVAITNKNIALVGNGYTITRSGTGRAFTITSSTVNIENLTFNSFSTSDCVVYYDSASSGSVVNTNFTNQASGTSALDIEGNVDVTNCLFKGNTVTSGALYYGSSATGTVSASTFNNTHNLYLANVNTITVSGNTFVCPTVTIDAITSPQSYHSTVTISGTFNDGTNRYSKHDVNIKNNDVSINVASLTSSNTYSYSYVNLTNGDYVISLDVVSDGNTYIYTTPTRSFTVSPANTIYIGPGATGDGSGVDINNLATWDTIGTRLADSGTVYFTDGTYLLSGKTISKPWTLTASSANNVIVNSSGSSYIFTSTVDNVHIKNLTLYSTGYPISTGSNVINVENSVLYNQLSVDPFSDPVYGDTITLDCTFIKITPSDLTAYVNGDELGTSTVSGSTYTITKNGNLAVGSYTLTLSKTDFKEV